MAFNIDSMPGCCTAKVMWEFRNYPGYGFEYTSNAERVDTSTYEGYVSWAKPYLIRACETLNTMEARNRVADNMTGLALVFATLRSDQEFALKYLKEVGFRNTKRSKKVRHPESDLFGLFIDTPSLYQWYLDNK